jgi:hypothetical protein
LPNDPRSGLADIFALAFFILNVIRYIVVIIKRHSLAASCAESAVDISG